MICCDCCHEWYHGECIGISALRDDIMSRDNEECVCPLCLQSSNDQFIQWPFTDLFPVSFQWGSCSGSGFCDAISSIYDEIVHWKRNLFQVPSGSSGRLLLWNLLVSIKHTLTARAWNLLHQRHALLLLP